MYTSFSAIICFLSNIKLNAIINKPMNVMYKLYLSNNLNSSKARKYKPILSQI